LSAAALKRETIRLRRKLTATVAIEQMIATVEEAMTRVIDWYGELPAQMNEAIDTFRVQLGAAIGVPLTYVKRALDRPAPETPREES